VIRSGRFQSGRCAAWRSERNLRKRSALTIPIAAATLSLANGKTESWVQDRTGHRSSLMVNRHLRTAPQASELGLDTLAPLDHAIPGLQALRRSSGPERV
jgi:hypothetical protein